MDLRRTQQLAGMLLLLFVCGGASGQCDSGAFYTPSGGKVTWSRCTSFIGWSNRTGYYFTRPAEQQIIEGLDRELVNSDNQEIDHPNARIVAYETLRRARDEMRGQTWPHPHLGVHQCDNPDCPYEVEQRKPHPLVKKIAGWAIGSYGTYLHENPEDWLVLREFSIAVALFNDFALAVEFMHSAYLNSPELGGDPFDEKFLSIDDRTLRELVVKAVKHAHRDPSDQAWLMVAILMQSEGRLERAAEMLQRAVDLGLDEAIALGFEGVLP